MTRKIAFVDIDNCLLVHGKLNLSLVEKLRPYDDVILFTQRSKTVQFQGIPASVMSAQAEAPGKGYGLITTADLVAKLSAALGNQPIKVSTSVDQFFGQPTQYYDKHLKDFEARVLDVATKSLDKDLVKNLKVFYPELDVEKGKLANKPELLEEKRSAQDPYPKGKVEQYNTLYDYLERECPDEIQVDYFDDDLENLKEIRRHVVPGKQPKCLVVAENYINTKEAYETKYPNMTPVQARKTADLAKDPMSLEGTLLEKLSRYIQANSTNKFKLAVKSSKISAAEKIIHYLVGGTPESFTSSEKICLAYGTLKDLVVNSGVDLNHMNSKSSPGPKS